jgi:hypothetical protein
MHKIALAAALTTLALGAALSAAQAENHYGPPKQGNMCFKRQTGNSLGYWAPCPPEQSATRGRTSTGSSQSGTAPKGQGQ